jgi:integrase
MSRIFKNTYIERLPQKCKITGKTVRWINNRGRHCTGTLTADGTGVIIESLCWSVKYKDENDKYKVVPTHTPNRHDAQKILNKLENDVIRIKGGIITRSELIQAGGKKTPFEIIVDDFLRHIESRNVSQKHFNNFKTRLFKLQLSQNIEYINDFNEATLEHWLSETINSKHLKNRTINQYLTSYSTFGIWCVRKGLINVSPTKYIKRLNPEIDQKYRRRAFTADEVNLIIENAANDKQRLFYQILVTTGLRSQELLKSYVSQFDVVNHRFTVAAAKTKNRTSDVLPLNSNTAKLIRKYVTKNKLKPDSYLFGQYIHRIQDKYYNVFKKDLKRAGIKQYDGDRKVDVHSFRKTFGTLLAIAGVPLVTVQRLMRHSDPKMTANLYLDIPEQNMQSAVDIIKLF